MICSCFCDILQYFKLWYVIFLGAAINLHSKNFTNFLVLEAKDRIGGRVQSTLFGGERVPLGAGWLHRANENHQIYLLAKKYNLTLYKDSYDISQIMFRYFLGTYLLYLEIYLL